MPTLEFKNKSHGVHKFKKGASVTIGRRKDNEKVVRESIRLKDLDIIEVGSVKLQFSNRGPSQCSSHIPSR